MVEINAFPPGVSIHVPLILLKPVSFHRGEAPKRWFVTHGAVLGRGIISLEHPFLKYIAAVNRMKHRICLLESWKGAYHAVCCIVNLSSMRPDKNKLHRFDLIDIHKF